MPQESDMTFEQVNAHVEQHFQNVQKMSVAAAAPKVCDIYKIVKPILKLIADAFFIPEKWRTAVKTLIAALDAICPGS